MSSTKSPPAPPVPVCEVNSPKVPLVLGPPSVDEGEPTSSASTGMPATVSSGGAPRSSSCTTTSSSTHGTPPLRATTTSPFISGTLPRTKSDDSIHDKLPPPAASTAPSEQDSGPETDATTMSTTKALPTTTATPPPQPPSSQANSSTQSAIAQNSSLRSSAPEYRPKPSPVLQPRTPPSFSTTSPPSLNGQQSPIITSISGAPPNFFDVSMNDLPPNAPPSSLNVNVPARNRQRTPPLTDREFGYDYILVLDFEATCEENTPANFLPEIIEFPVVMIDTFTRRVVAEFHSYVRPTHNAVLSDFCRSLTGITQQQIDLAPTLQEVIRRFEEWYRSFVPAGKTSIFATDGPWDLRDFMYRYSVCEGIANFPPLFYRWLDVKETFAGFFNSRHGKIQAMLEKLQLGEFEGRLHSGLDDARNIARIVIAMLDRGCTFPRLCEISDPECEQPWARHRRRGDNRNGSDQDRFGGSRTPPPPLPASRGNGNNNNSSSSSTSTPVRIATHSHPGRGLMSPPMTSQGLFFSPSASTRVGRGNHNHTNKSNGSRGSSPPEASSKLTPPTFEQQPPASDATAALFHRLVNSSSQQFPSLPSAHETAVAAPTSSSSRHRGGGNRRPENGNNNNLGDRAGMGSSLTSHPCESSISSVRSNDGGGTGGGGGGPGSSLNSSAVFHGNSNGSEGSPLTDPPPPYHVQHQGASNFGTVGGGGQNPSRGQKR